MNSIHHRFKTTLLLASGLLVACAPSHAETEPHPAVADRTRPPIPVTLAAVRQAPIDTELVVLGRVTHNRDVKLAFKTGGVVAELMVDEGQRVQRGQVVARLDTQELDAGLAQVRAGLAKANRDLTRVKNLETQAVLPGSTREDAETARAVAAAQLRGLKWNLGTATLTADCDGIVLKRLAEPGEVVGPGHPVLVIGDDTTGARVEVGIPTRELARATIGQVVTLKLEGSTEILSSTIVDLAPTLTPGTDRLSAFIALPDGVRPPRGLVVTVTMPARTTPTLAAIPLSTVVEGEGRNASVWVPASAASPAPGTGAETRATTVNRMPITIHSIRPDGLVLVEDGLHGISHVIDAGQAWLDTSAMVVVGGAP